MDISRNNSPEPHGVEEFLQPQVATISSPSAKSSFAKTKGCFQSAVRLVVRNNQPLMLFQADVRAPGLLPSSVEDKKVCQEM